jgi:hypothetical protein
MIGVSVSPVARRRAAPALALLAALGLGACGTSVSTSSFTGPKHEVAQALANLQSHANASEYDKICSSDITRELREKLGGKSGCEQAFKRQLGQTDNLELVVQSVTIEPGGAKATATVKTTFAGKKRPNQMRLVKEEGAWRVAGL